MVIEAVNKAPQLQGCRLRLTKDACASGARLGESTFWLQLPRSPVLLEPQDVHFTNQNTKNKATLGVFRQIN